jgi:ASC-1-like (ASCH) protein
VNHVAIIDSKKKLLDKILSGEKTIESRWYIKHKPPFGKIKIGDALYFKESSKPISLKSTVHRFNEYHNLTYDDKNKLFDNYHKDICISKSERAELMKKSHILLVWFTDVKEINHFSTKKGNPRSAWIIARKLK